MEIRSRFAVLLTATVFVVLVVSASAIAAQPPQAVFGGISAQSADGTPDGTPDDDGDGVSDSADNCVHAANTDQLDTDGDAIGNACDSDSDNDGVPNPADTCPLVNAPGADGCPIPPAAPAPADPLSVVMPANLGTYTLDPRQRTLTLRKVKATVSLAGGGGGGAAAASYAATGRITTTIKNPKTKKRRTILLATCAATIAPGDTWSPTFEFTSSGLAVMRKKGQATASPRLQFQPEGSKGNRVFTSTMTVIAARR
ncbi:MAG: thrombospondin type 3 repeat-containing protein [Actinobacteria bacterium]|nr:thrombospondin type 3 repeat-containing protein [Actinomycetota bacterium]